MTKKIPPDSYYIRFTDNTFWAIPAKIYLPLWIGIGLLSMLNTSLPISVILWVIFISMRAFFRYKA